MPPTERSTPLAQVAFSLSTEERKARTFVTHMAPSGDVVDGGQLANCTRMDERPSRATFQTHIRLNKRETRSDIWERSCILVTCCNHIATIKLTFDDVEIENSSGMPLSPPPPLQNSVLIPSSWRIEEKTEDFSLIDSQQGGDIGDISKKSREAQFIMDKDSLGEQYNEYDINFKIAKLECKKLQMQHHVERNAPYLALDIPDIEELTLSPNLPIPKKKKIKDIVDNTKRILADASMRNQIFSESSSSRSKSSRSSIVEFPY
ncbi:unnamed protein product [Phaedon cochleariae]|uniref:Uncharacterized protein n=1 Tax=Phaedon cochleariae TaxID=80249 RepID=A0A9N9SHT7_PHACE|nr:unnamed protein product [Phaedon cochleariae]